MLRDGMVGGGILVAVLLLTAPVPAAALPALQLYVEGGTYDSHSETWLLSGEDAKLWVIGDVNGHGTMSDVRLIVALPRAAAGAVTLTPTVASPGLLPAPGDVSTPALPTIVSHPLGNVSGNGCSDLGTAGTTPCRSNSQKLSPHGLYGQNTRWQEWALGAFDRKETPIADFVSAFPSIPTGAGAKLGQINVYDVHLEGMLSGTPVHFDALAWGDTFAPFSHDVQLTFVDERRAPQVSVAEPGTLGFLGSGLLGLLGLGLRRRR